MKRVALHTLGCKLNYAETSTLGRQFVSNGYTVVGADEPSDVFVLNTCSVTERADRECRQLIRRALRHSPETYVVVVGCYAQLQPAGISSIDGVDLVLGTSEKFRIFERAGSFRKTGIPQSFVSCIGDAGTAEPAYAADEAGRTRAFLKIQDGCDFPCTFCTIPLARGESRSIPAGDVIRQAEELGARGFREIVLTGVNIADYLDADGTTFAGLLKRLDTCSGVGRFRLSSTEPNLLTEPLIRFVLGSGRFCRHFHIPLQSGSDDILRQMKRRYTTDRYRQTVELIRSIDPFAGIGLDVMVGFPGETDRHFDETRRFIADLPVSYLHVFTYSERGNTRAAELPGAVAPEVRARRSETLRDLGRRLKERFQNSMIGRTERVLVESGNGQPPRAGYASNYLRVEISAGDPPVNEFADVRVESVDGEVAAGRLIDLQPDERKNEGTLDTMLFSMIESQSVSEST